MSNLEFHPEQAVGEKLLQMDKQELLQFVSRLCLHLKAEIGSRAYHGGIFPENICADEKGGFAIGPARMEKWTGQELEFVAPELYWHGEAGPAADVYSLALLVYYGLNEGRLPFETATASGQLARMSGKALPAPKAAGKRLGEVLEKATSFQAGDRYQNPEELQIMLESCMDNKFLGGSSGAEAIFRKEDDQLSDLERMMVDIIENSPVDDEEEESPEESLEGLSIEEVAGLEKPDYTPPEKEDLNAMVEEFFGLSVGEGESAPAPEEDGEEIRVYQPSKDKKDRQPIPILTEEKNPELAPVVLQQQPSFERTRRRGQEEQEAEPDPAQEVRKRRSRRPLTVVLLLCLLLLAGALGVNAYWNRGVRPTQINPTPDPQKLYETHPSILPTTEAGDPGSRGHLHPHGSAPAAPLLGGGLGPELDRCPGRLRGAGGTSGRDLQSGGAEGGHRPGRIHGPDPPLDRLPLGQRRPGLGERGGDGLLQLGRERAQHLGLLRQRGGGLHHDLPGRGSVAV